MKQKINKIISKISVSIFAMLLTVTTISAAPVVRSGSGANAAAIQAIVDQFRADLGGALNPNTASTFLTGRREINWDGVPDTLSAPNLLPTNFFNVNSPRGITFSSPCSSDMQVSADSSNPTATAVRFGNIDPSYQTNFTTFSAERLFSVTSGGNLGQAPCNIVNIDFFIPGTSIPATVSGFGVVLVDVDLTFKSLLRCTDDKGAVVVGQGVPVASSGLSFVGVSFNAGERISKCSIRSGSDRLVAGNVDTASIDIVVMDDFIYGEPRAVTFHSGDFDGDGVTDTNIFRPSTGTWFTLHSGSNTVTQENFGLNGDIPVDGDFDGDSRADLAIFRPSNGIWFFKRSSNGTTLGATFGQNGDKPVVGDYDRDGKSDIAIWRPSTGTHFILRSSTDFSTFFSHPFGSPGDIPVQGGAQ